VLSRAVGKRNFCTGRATLLLVLFCFSTASGRAASVPALSSPNEIRIPRGRAIVADGVKSAPEWDDASMTQFAVMPGWNVRVFAKHDAQYLYFDFEGVTHGGKRLFPEILLDPHNTHSAAWQKGSGGCTSRIVCAKGMARRTFTKRLASFSARGARLVGI
jgi:hypothetical protein